MGGSWIITVSPAPLMMLPEQDIAAEAATSFPTLIAPDGFGCGNANSATSSFTGLFVGCSVISSREDSELCSPWPLHINSSECLLLLLRVCNSCC
jgi:hypothetical protein